MISCNSSFPCILSDSDFHAITELRSQLSDVFEKLATGSVPDVKLSSIEIYQTQKAFTELLKYRHTYGALFTSYFLRRSIITLDYVASCLANSKKADYSELISTILHGSFMLGSILQSSYELYLEDLQ